jgi:penicillin-binding protein 1A
MIVDAPFNWGNWSPHNYGNSYAGRITLTTALAKSINTVPVRLVKERLGVDSVVRMAKAMGVETPIRKDVTIPLGTSEVTVMDQATAYGVLAAGGVQSRRHGIDEILDYRGNVLYNFERDEEAPRRVLTQQASDYMNQMLTKVPYIGTGRKAALDGILTAGKSGTTQAYRDAWFVGFTGNFTTAVWFGNDDYTSTNNMTGGSLPAMTFKTIMDYAHQGIGIRPIPGVKEPAVTIVKTTKPAKGAPEATPTPGFVRPRSLSVETTALLRTLGDMLTEAKPLSTHGTTEALN